MAAAASGSVEVVQVLIAAGANRERRSKVSRCALRGWRARARALVSTAPKRLTPHARAPHAAPHTVLASMSQSGRTALDWAKENKQQDVVTLMEAVQPSAASPPNAPDLASSCASKTRSLDSSPVSVVSNYTF